MIVTPAVLVIIDQVSQLSNKNAEVSSWFLILWQRRALNSLGIPQVEDQRSDPQKIKVIYLRVAVAPILELLHYIGNMFVQIHRS